MVAHFGTVLQRPVVLLLPRDDGFRMVPPNAGLLDDAALKAAQHAWNGLPADPLGAQGVSASRWSFHPLAAAHGRVGLLAVADHGRQSADLEQPGLRALLEHAATVIERATRANRHQACG
jgi:K+-sensing histidine kinase KdpD